MQKVVILGIGTMGKQIASLLHIIGYDVVVWGHRSDDKHYKSLERSIKLAKRQFGVDHSIGQITLQYDISVLPKAIYIESVVEDLSIKKDIYNQVKQRATTYFTNSSSFAPSDISDDIYTMHFFNPINMKILEYSGDNSFVDDITRRLKELDFSCFKVANNRGYIGNYILFSEISNIFKLIEKNGYGYKEVQSFYEKLYINRDIFKIIDIVGIDITFTIIKNLNEIDSSVYLPKYLEKAIKNGILGKKNQTSITEVFDLGMDTL